MNWCVLIFYVTSANIGSWGNSIFLEEVENVDVAKFHEVFVTVLANVQVGKDVHVEEEHKMKSPPNFENTDFICL